MAHIWAIMNDIMDSRAVLRKDTWFYMGMLPWPLEISLYGINVLVVYQKYSR